MIHFICAAYMHHAFTYVHMIDGQYLASRLSQSISKESAKLRDLITGYNNLVVENEKLMWADVSNLSSVLWESEVLSTLNSDIPAQVKLEAIKNHHLALRADEEISMLRQDMLATLQFYIRDWNLLTDKINELMDSRNANGEICSLQYARLETEFKIEKMVTLFSLYIDIPPIPTNDFLLHQINYVQQDSDHVEAVEILGSTVDCISNEGDTNEWEEESDIGMYVQYICACIMFAICESNVVLFWPYVCPYNGMYYVHIYQQYIYIYMCIHANLYFIHRR